MEEKNIIENVVIEKNDLHPYDRVKIARSKDRAVITDYIEHLFTDFVELKGDRLSGEDSSILGGIALFHGMPVTIIGHRKGKNTEDNIKYNFGMGSPEGYRKALRLMKQAEKFHRPVITFVDTPGAYPGIDAENHGQSIALAQSIATMSSLKTPIIAIVTGEGSSGGALALATADQVWMLENAIYSILSPEGFASILWKDSQRAKEASEVMRLTARDLLEFGIIDEIVEEGKELYSGLDQLLMKSLKELKKPDIKELLLKRYTKFRKIGRVDHE